MQDKQKYPATTCRCSSSVVERIESWLEAAERPPAYSQGINTSGGSRTHTGYNSQRILSP